MTSKERVLATLSHQSPDCIPLDFGGTFITGMHCSCVEQLRRHYGLEQHPVKLCEPYQMLGLVEDDLKDAMGLDVTSIFPNRTMFGFVNENWKPFKTWWGQEILVSEHFNTTTKADGIYIYPEGDTTARPSAHMPSTGYFFDTIIRQEPIDEDRMNPEDNLEEFKLMGEEEKRYWKNAADSLRGTNRAVITHLNGTCLGDIALVPAAFLKNPKGIRDISEWYMALVSNPDYIHAIFSKQTELALKNLESLNTIAGDVIDVVVVCGTDFGTQESTFCSGATFDQLWLPYYKQINQWIHSHTNWKTFKHSCGAIECLLPHFIEAGFDIVNPVQCSAKGMDPQHLKTTYGDKLTFWGGGVNTQATLPFGTPAEVREEVLKRCDIFSRNGGFVFNSIHNVQALTPIENIVAMIDAVKEFNGKGIN
ncbi:MAG: uroporphyrinogen decarboxylase family protein [Verrucomicrobiota bacterium]|nr:uroporphyrinogen decarboxylase family protein [Verrucomicrobiota bacterium]